MAVSSQVQFSALSSDIRLDAEYYRPEHLALDRLVSMAHAQHWEEIPGRFIVGPFGSAFLVENYVDTSPWGGPLG